MGLFCPTGKYKSVEVVNTTQLVALSDQTISEGKGRLFVTIHANNAYTYYTEVESEFAGDNDKAYVSRTISRGNITVVEEENCQEPRLVVYSQEAKGTFWSFGIGVSRDNYVFYVPEGTIAHDFSLN